jgi:type I restriction enzyme S subunit
MNTAEETMELAPWTGTVPHGWRVTRLDAVADVLFSNVDKHTLDNEDPVRLCNYVDVYKNDRITSRIEFMEASADVREIRKFQIRRGDVLATKDSETADDIAIPSLVADELPGVLCGYHLAMIRPRLLEVEGAFLGWLHASKSFRAQYEAKAVGVTRFGLSQYVFRAARVPLPPLPEQQRIAAYLDASCAVVDTAVAAKRRQREILLALRSAIIREAVMGGVDPKAQRRDPAIPGYTNTPVHWRRGQLRYEIEIGSGDFASDKIVDHGEFAIYGGNGVMDRTDRFNVDGETVVIGRVGAYCGNAHYVHGKAWVSDNALVVKSRHAAQYLCHLFNALNFNAQANNTAQPVITGTKIKGTVVAVPPLAEQKAICVHLDQKLAELKQLVTSIESQIDTLASYRKSLIHECVTGQRRITEADVRAIQERAAKLTKESALPSLTA